MTDLLLREAHKIVYVVELLQFCIHKDNHKWWHDKDGNPIERNKGELIALMHSELSECLEGVRKNLQDDHLPEFKMEVVELADTIIRIFDYAEGYRLPLAQAIMKKLLYNRERADHKHEARAAADGKKF